MTSRLWQIHSWLGLIAGIGLLIIGLTGSLLLFRSDLELLTHPSRVRVTNPQQARLPLDTLLANARHTLPDYEITGWVFPPDPRLPDYVYVTRHGESESLLVFVDPRSGDVRAEPIRQQTTFVSRLVTLHYEFLAGPLGQLLAGLLAVLLCLLGLTGVWLYRDFWRNLFRLQWRVSGQIFFSNLHKTVGISSVAFHLLLGFTGAYWNLPQALASFHSHRMESPKVTQHFYADTLSMDHLLAQATEQLPGIHVSSIFFPASPGGTITLYGGLTGHPLHSDYSCHVMFDAQTGTCKSVHDIRQSGRWAQVTDMFYPLHFGTFGGWPVKILWCLGGLSPGVLAVTGFILWRQRKAA